jgi:hypothetical protein
VLTCRQHDIAKVVEELIPRLTPAQHRKLLMKLDFTILLVCWILYWVNALDRASIGNAGACKSNLVMSVIQSDWHADGFRKDVGAVRRLPLLTRLIA